MVHKKKWIKFHEDFHGREFDSWQNMTPQEAKRQVAQWNSFGNPREELSIVRISETKPKNLIRRPTGFVEKS